MSLLGLQSQYAPDHASRKMFEDSQERITSTALAQELLNQSEDLVDINIKEYVSR